MLCLLQSGPESHHTLPICHPSGLYRGSLIALWQRMRSLVWGLLGIQERARVGPTGHAFVAQVKLVAEMTPYITIKSFVHEGMSHTSFQRGGWS